MKKKEYYSIGIMSGTSLDGIDISLIKTDGNKNIDAIKNEYFDFEIEFINEIKSLITNVNTIGPDKTISSNDFININKKFSNNIIEKINLFLDNLELEKEKIDVIGLHGITLFHAPDKKISFQLGNSKLISENVGIRVVSDFRINDINNGGQGAPLVPIYHDAIFSEENKNIVVVNIGGISNYTMLIGKELIYASDIGPGNVLLDRFCSKYLDENYDNNGKYSAKGKVIHSLIDDWKNKDFMRIKHPVSFDNYYFKLDNYISANFDNYDLLRTLTFFTALTISNVQNKYNYHIDEWIFSGGGIKNKTLMTHLRELLSTNEVKISNEKGFESDFIESQAFAYISVRTLMDLPSAFPETTGCEVKNVCGKIFNP